MWLKAAEYIDKVFVFFRRNSGDTDLDLAIVGAQFDNRSFN